MFGNGEERRKGNKKVIICLTCKEKGKEKKILLFLLLHPHKFGREIQKIMTKVEIQTNKVKKVGSTFLFAFSYFLFRPNWPDCKLWVERICFLYISFSPNIRNSFLPLFSLSLLPLPPFPNIAFIFK